MRIRRNPVNSGSPLFLLLLFLLIAGCVFAPEYKEAELKTINDVKAIQKYKSKTVMMPVVNRAYSVGAGLVSDFQETFAAEMKKAFKKGLITLPDSPAYDALLEEYQEKVKTDETSSFLDVVKQKGYQSIVTVAFMDIQTRSENEGLWWFKGIQHSVVMRISGEAIDTGTGARLASHDRLIDIEIEADVAAMIDSRQTVSIPDLDEAVLEVAEDLGETLGEMLADLRWQGIIISEAGEPITFSPGKDVGVREGDRFYVFDGSRRITGGDGVSYVIPGYKTGEIKAETLFPDRVEAVLVSGDKPKNGDFVLPVK